MTSVGTLPVVFYATTLVALPTMTAFWVLIGAAAIGGALAGLVGLLGLARPSLTLEPGSRDLIWRLRKSEVRLRWESIEFAREGKALIVRTQAGPIHASLRGCPGEPQFRQAVEALERDSPPSPGTPPSITWPAKFTAALDFIDFQAIGPAQVRFLSGQMRLLTFCLLLMGEIGLAFGIAELHPPPAAVPIILIALLGWPFLFRVREVVIERGSRSLVIRRWRGHLRENLTPSMLQMTRIEADGNESFGMKILALDHTLILPGLAIDRNTVEDAGQALLEFSGTGSVEGHGADRRSGAPTPLTL
jgi:hypothetical protein